ncbi:MAG: hypothetical protein CSH36_09075 [Thalassolituus sp.]|jgi:acyl-CoA thioesterase FadM|uniref:thioesterase family protein n=1 Tax=Thalassolituus sp. TaxID=2030822 RepID=UPI00261C0DD7|nr:thioesterase family protein [uncultured Thalassolituus sp.]TNC91554.1 MAG: hypothetical protein CSH36_09075 [Thalassolituus sp.]
MNLFIRFFWCWLSGLGLRHDDAAAPELSFRIWPHDMGWRLHLPNFRFLSYMELGRFRYWYGVKHRLQTSPGTRLIAAQDMVYIRPVAFLAKLDMTTRMVARDRKYVYFQHDFFVGKTLVATGMVKEACVVQGSVISPDEVFCGEAPQDAAQVVEAWAQMHTALRGISGRR